ncbi:MAG TPA: protease pro-enzyme activation domain-containing protein [Verrucomicrobiae bacterium]|nr:protease pro-enzyme activation domain-containing protein [Verrucomicrobiae bacterium]
MALLGWAMAAPGSGAEMRVVAGHRPGAVDALQAIGGLPPDHPLHLAIGLPLQHTNELADLLARLYNPSDPLYRHFLTPQQFCSRFSPTLSQYESVIAFVRQSGFKIAATSSNRMLVDISGPVSKVERAFNVRLSRYRHPTEAREFFAPDRQPSVPSAIPIIDIDGLSDYALPRPHIRPTQTAFPKAGSASGGAYMGGDFRAAYVPGVPLNGAGQSVGLLEFDGFYTNDILRYDQDAGLSQVPLQTILIDKFSGMPSNTTNNTEVSMDIEAVESMAPGLSNILVYEAYPTNSPNDILNQMVEDNAASQIGCSWGWSGGPSAATDQILQQMAAQGISFFCASGDGDAYLNGAVDDPSSDNAPSDSAYLTVVGGTTLTTTGPAGAWQSETVWNWGGGNGSAGGISSYYTIPSWQEGISMQNNGGSASWRNIPDVALTADNIYVVCNNGVSGSYGGTSCATALWAGFMALVNQQAATARQPPVGFVNPAIYQIGAGENYSASFHDIITGDNFSPSSPTSFAATVGYDLCTGWGTPAGYNLIVALTAPPDPLQISPAAGFVSTGLQGGPFSVMSQELSLTNSSSTNLAWSISPDVSWLTISPVNGDLSAASQSPITVTVNAAATNLPAGNYIGTVWCTNLTTGNAQNRQFRLNVLKTLVQNGGFESGGFNDWTYIGDPTYVSVTFNQYYVHSGVYGAELGPSGALGYLGQTIPTVPGLSYLLSFWLVTPLATSNEFNLSWNGALLCDQTNFTSTSWTNLQFIVFAAATNSTLQFGFRDDPAFFGLDDISLTPFTLPALQPVPETNAAPRFSWNAVSNTTYQIQFTTNLTAPAWQTLSSLIAPTTGVMTFTDAPSQSAQKFYRILVIP